MTIAVYGIKNCNTVKKAREWLDKHKVAYEFHDYKVEGVDPKRLQLWCDEFGWEALINRNGTTFRALPEADKNNLGAAKATKLMLAQPSMIRRPIVDLGARRLVGFRLEDYREAFRK